MKTRVFLLLAFTMLTLAFTGCEDDVPPANNVGSITFIITEENTPETLSKVTIELYSNSDPSVTQTDRTDNSGRCTFSNIPVGTYQVNIRKSGYESKSNLTLRINGGNNPYKEISLKRATNVLTVAPDVLDFGENASVVQKAFTLVNPNYQDLTWAVLDTDVPWIVSVCDKDGKKNGTIKYNQEVAMSVTIDRSKLDKGNNESTIVILSDYGRAELVVKAVGADRRYPETEMVDAKIVDVKAAVFEGKVLSVGSPMYEERGFVYSTSFITETATQGFTKLPAQMNSQSTFTASVDNLTPGKTYYVRAYGKNTIGLKLSSTYESFTTTATETSVSTLSISNKDVKNGSVRFKGSIDNVGSPAYSEKGFCYKAGGEPTISDSKGVVSGTGSGSFYFTCTGLSLNVTYYVKAYAIQNGLVYYGTSQPFSLSYVDSVVQTNSAAKNITYDGADVSFIIKDLGEPSCSDCGICYGTSYEPTINSNRKTGVVKTSTNNITLSGLKESTTYYYRAYVIQEGTAIYGTTYYFDTATKPSVSTLGYSNLQNPYALYNCWQVQLKGRVDAKGDPAISSRGFVYSTAPNPSAGSNKATVSGSSTGEFSTTVTGLYSNTTYYYQAFVKNDLGYEYGDVESFTTPDTPSPW